jgi:hypothetical protein
MSASTEPPAARLRSLVNGYQVTQAIHAAAVLGIADRLPGGVDELAAATGAHEDALYRLLRALASVGVLHEEDGRRFSLTELGGPLRTDAPDSIAGWAEFVGTRSYRDAWAALPESVRSGENAFELVHGTDVWTYRSTRPEESAAFDRAMTALTRGVHRAVLDAYDWSRFGTVVDVGGGRGALLAELLAANPSLRGVLFDQPHVVAGAEETFAAAGVADRCEIVAGSFFESVPRGDAHVLKMIVHDWEDAECVAILRACRDAGGTLLVLDRELGGPNENPGAKLSDLNMLVGPGGRERTLAEFESLFDRAGFRLVGSTPAGAISVIEGEPA